MAKTNVEPATASTGSGRLQRVLLPHHGSRFGALDGYRALAALAVVVYHLARLLWWSRLGGEAGVGGALLSNLGNFGVTIFFLLSGFLLYRPFARAALADERSPATLRFLRHRVLRIYPAYWLALTAAIVLVGVANTSGEKYAILYLLVQNYREGHALLGLGVAWTLVIEVSFYITLPFLAWGIRLLGRPAASVAGRMRAQLLGLGMLAALSLIYRVTFAVPSRPSQTTHLWLPNFLDWFALGMLLGVCVAWVDLGGRLPRWFQALADNWWAPVLLAAQSYVVLALLRLDARSGSLGAGQESEVEMVIRFFFNGVGAFFLLLPVVLGRNHLDALHRVLGARVLAVLGTLSYGIYLWHTIWINVVTDWTVGRPLPPDPPLVESASLVVSVLALTVASALASFLLVEHPVMRFKDPVRRRSRVRGEPVEPVVVADPVSGLGG